MQVVLLAGGFGTRLMEETVYRPKPMVEIGGRPLLWHIMHLYARYGFRQFVVACGYKAEMIKEYFSNFFLHNSDFEVDLAGGGVKLLQGGSVDWRVTVIDTGLQTQTGGRIRRLRSRLEQGTFMVTYGDGLADVDIARLLEFHRGHGRLATVTAVRPPARFGALDLEGDRVRAFTEKLSTTESWINGGFFVFEPGIFAYLAADATLLEREPLESLARDGQLMAYRHQGFWQPVDTQRERMYLESLWSSGRPPWMG
ncbi:MAG: glucose-1-phosphate cytidylyltransferase [Pirellulales bacterium]|nr:glucose-1-phosphate cytidylyltransferase [Pirellulales bacterium]